MIQTSVEGGVVRTAASIRCVDGAMHGVIIRIIDEVVCLLAVICVDRVLLLLSLPVHLFFLEWSSHANQVE